MMTIGFLTWANPLWGLAGLAAVAAPLIAHLLSRQVARSAVFPSIRFLRQAIDESRRRSRWRDLLLLLLRCAALLLVVAAFARPSWTATAPAIGAAGIDVILLVDRSASMSRARQGATLFDEARQLALKELAALDPLVDRAAVVWIDGDPRPLLPELSANLSLLGERLRQATPTYERGRVEAALRQIQPLAASRQTTAQPAPHLRIVLLSDFQSSHWPSPQAVAAALPADTAIDWRPVSDDSGNIALHRPVVSPSLPVVGQPAEISVELAHHGERSLPARTVEVQLEFGDATQSQVVNLPAGAAVTTRFIVAPRKTGIARVTFSAQVRGGDALRADDTVGLFLRVVESRDVLLISRADGPAASTMSFYLHRALAPAALGSTDTTINAARVQVVAPDALPARLDAAVSSDSPTNVLPVVMLADGGSLEVAAKASLHRFLSRGGGAVWFIDGEQAADVLSSFNRSLRADESGTLLWRRRPVAIRSGPFEHPVLRVFGGAARSELLATTFAAALSGKLDESWQPLLVADDGSALLALRPIGAGRLAIVGADLSPGSSTLVKGALFAPLVHQLMHHVAPGPPPRDNPAPGTRITLSSSGPAAHMKIRGPDGGHIAGVQSPAESVALIAESPGPYELLADKSQPSPLDGAWVEIDPLESDTRSGIDLAAVSPPLAASRQSTPVPARSKLIELWPWCLAAAGSLLIIESLITFALRLRTSNDKPPVSDVALSPESA